MERESKTETRAIERFELLRRLGAGAMGVVYEARDRERDRIVALKTLPIAESDALFRFKREFRTLADISHPNLVNLYELFIEPDQSFFTMEKVDGASFIDHVRGGAAKIGDLDTIIHEPAPISEPARPRLGDDTLLQAEPAPDDRTGEPTVLGSTTPETSTPIGDRVHAGGLDLERLRAALRQLVEGVAALHAAGKLHRDLKPSNVMVDADGRVVILDFGLAVERHGPGSKLGDELTGTAAYMAPEQVAGATSPASDWYAVGVMLYEALTGRLPFTGTMIQVLMRKRDEDPIPPEQLAPDIPEDLARLCGRLLRRDPEQRPDAEELLAALGGQDSGLFDRSLEHALVGREHHLAALDDAFATVGEGEAVSVYVHGPSGTGKSSLIEAYLAQRAADVVILRGRCYVHESVPYKALDGVIDSLRRFLAERPADEARAILPRSCEALAQLFPVMRGALENLLGRKLETPPGLDRLELRRRAFQALREFLARLGDRRRVIIYIDDLQWADGDSALLLEELLRPPDPPTILMIASFRSEEVAHQPFLGTLLSHAGTRTCRALSVGPLTERQVQDLVLRLLDDIPAARVFIPTIIREASGSPFLAEQLATYVLTGDDVAATGVSMAEMLHARVRGQPRGAEALLDTLAVAAHPLPAAVAAAAAAVKGDERPLVKSLVNSKLLRVSGAEEHLELYHDRLRETLAARLDPMAARDIHGRVAAAMEAHGLDDPEALYGHHRGAGNSERAAHYAERAALKASEALAFDQAAQFFKIALSAHDEADTGEFARRGQLEIGLADALANAGHCREAALAYQRAAERVDAQRSVDLRRAAAEQLLSSGHLNDGIQVLAEVLEEVGWRLAPTPKRALVSLLARRARLKLHGYKFTETREADVPTDALLRIDICWGISIGLSLIDNIRAADFTTRGLLLALQAGEPVRIARALSMEAGFLGSGGGKARARAFELSRQSLALAEKTGNVGAIAQATMIAGACAYLAGQWRVAAERSAEADVMLRERCPGAVWQKVSAVRFNVGALMYLGEIAELRRRMTYALRDADERGNLFSDNDLKARIFMHWLADDDPEGHREKLGEALARWPADGFHIQHFNALRSLIHGDLYEGAYERASERFKDAWPALKGSMLLRVQVVRAEAHQLRAMTALACVQEGHIRGSSRARTLAMVAGEIKEMQAEDEPWIHALATLLQASLDGLRGDAAGLRRQVEAAAKRFDDCAMALHAAVARRQLGILDGGSAGGEAVARADAFMTGQRIRNPQRVAACLAPALVKA